ncbi:hypothetical protein MANES_02G221250v8 [Manihot esculenta]|uniref:Uncharacterized protein n=1 Tax=Manihot esculenta TaxID=3983 RepID=A0ACB7I7Z4_MANES|nr:hypothetical protein MANES_02G221250v8 [Manihot esculenta]
MLFRRFFWPCSSWDYVVLLRLVFFLDGKGLILSRYLLLILTTDKTFDCIMQHNPKDLPTSCKLGFEC